MLLTYEFFIIDTIVLNTTHVLSPLKTSILIAIAISSMRQIINNTNITCLYKDFSIIHTSITPAF